LALRKEDPTIAELLKPFGYVTGQFGKNHLWAIKDEFLPTNHGFDEFFGNLYHLNAEEEARKSRLPPGAPTSRRKFGPRGVLKATAGGKIEDTRPTHRRSGWKRSDEEVLAAGRGPLPSNEATQGDKAVLSVGSKNNPQRKNGNNFTPCWKRGRETRARPETRGIFNCRTGLGRA